MDWKVHKKELIISQHYFFQDSILFICQLTCQSADIMASLCGIRVRVNNFFSKSTRARDMLLLLKDTLCIEDDKS